VNGVRLFFDVEGAKLVPDGPANASRRPRLRPFDLQACLLGGEDDPLHPIENQADIAAALPGHLVQFERFANCGMPWCPTRRDRPWPSFATSSHTQNKTGARRRR
jgi:hypothetical protein